MQGLGCQKHENPKPTHPLTTEIEHQECPSCGENAKSVKEITLRALLQPEAKARIIDGSFRFCATQDCDVVYFTEDWASVFKKDELSVRVGIKETSPPRHVCYCFDHTIEEIEKDIRETGETSVLEDIKTRMKEACWCETKSPMGSCCLGTVSKHVKAAALKYAKENSPSLPETKGETDCCAHK